MRIFNAWFNVCSEGVESDGQCHDSAAAGAIDQIQAVSFGPHHSNTFPCSLCFDVVFINQMFFMMSCQFNVFDMIKDLLKFNENQFIIIGHKTKSQFIFAV